MIEGLSAIIKLSMLDTKFIRENKDLVQQAAKNKNITIDIDHILHIDAQYKDVLQSVEKLRSEMNILSKSISTVEPEKRTEKIEEGKKLKEILEKQEHSLSALKEELRIELLKVPNVPATDVPVGPDESGNQEIKKVGEIPTFSFPVKSHDVLAADLDLYDTKHAAKIGGTRSYFLKKELVMLEQAVLNYALHFMISQGFTPMTVPWMVNKDALWGTGYFPWGIEDHYQTQDGQGLIGTSEVSLTAYYKDEILDEKDLPIKFIGISPCFRREVGSYGKDTKGFIRVHQFNKVEQVVLTVADEDETRKWHGKMVELSEKLLQALGLSYRVLLMCTGDMGAGQRKKYDIETWFPSQNTYRETHSASYFNDFQSRRLNMRYRTKDGETKFVYTLNNTVVATPRLLAAILENYQQEDGSIIIPQVLRKYTSFDKIPSEKTS